ncbi:MAG: VOC family protein [Pseudomonadota bacterium]
MELDHIAISGVTLEEASDYVETALGVVLQPGGKHDAFGTHNRLLGLADGLYLEAIAADPSAPAPDRPRWFDLDNFSGPARLTNWVCRVSDLDKALAELPLDVGAPMALSRGDLRWQMAVSETGLLPFDNLCPALISWQGDLHPAAMLADRGCRLRRLIVSHPEARKLNHMLGNLSHVVFEAGPHGLRAEFDTPGGRRWLD